MKRRDFLASISALAIAPVLPKVAFAGAPTLSPLDSMADGALSVTTNEPTGRLIVWFTDQYGRESTKREIEVVGDFDGVSVDGLECGEAYQVHFEVYD
jgi:hypothetical protein